MRFSGSGGGGVTHPADQLLWVAQQGNATARNSTAIAVSGLCTSASIVDSTSARVYDAIGTAIQQNTSTALFNTAYYQDQGGQYIAPEALPWLVTRWSISDAADIDSGVMLMANKFFSQVSDCLNRTPVTACVGFQYMTSAGDTTIKRIKAGTGGAGASVFDTGIAVADYTYPNVLIVSIRFLTATTCRVQLFDASLPPTEGSALYDETISAGLPTQELGAVMAIENQTTTSKAQYFYGLDIGTGGAVPT